MKELVILSGKGGTGKSSIAASLALLADRPVVVDGDVDASNLYILLGVKELQRIPFDSGREAIIDSDLCTQCGLCLTECRFNAIELVNRGEGAEHWIDPLGCEGCGLCVRLCPAQAIEFPKRRCGVSMLSEGRSGPLVHARLDAGAENSGKLVSEVRRRAAKIARKENRPWVLVDGPPGIGCAPIATVTGATAALLVVEPTVSGQHDLLRVLQLVNHFGVKPLLCVNKWDLNPALCEQIEEQARERGATVVGRVQYHRGVVQAQLRGESALESGGEVEQEIRSLWSAIQEVV